MSQRVAIVGAGLAGSALARSLCQRGWSVTLFDQHPAAAGGASALPVGMLSPHHTAQPTPMSELSELGVPLIRQWLEQVDPDRQGWMETQVLHWPEKRLPETPARTDSALTLPAITLVRAWLNDARKTDRLTCRWSTRVQQIERLNSQWRLFDAQGQALGEFPVLVMCNAYGAQQWLSARGFDLRPVAGQMTLGPAPLKPPAERPGKCKGVYVPWFLGANPQSSGFAFEQPVWTAGSTYRRGDALGAVLVADHTANRAAIERTYPDHLLQFDRCQESGQLHAWTGVRCASVDRMPLVGPVSDQPTDQGLYCLVALGSRGLSVAGICAQALSEWINEGRVQCLPEHLVQALDPRRFLRRAQAKNPTNKLKKTAPVDINHRASYMKQG